MDILEKLYTREDYAAFTKLPENRGRRFELIHGEIVEKVTTEEHSIIAGLIITEINLYFRQNKIGRAGVEMSHAVPDDDINERIPDVSVRIHPPDAISRKGAVNEMPEIAIEIKSPGNTYKSLRAKAEYYLRHGAQSVWLIYPEKRLIEVYHQSADIKILTGQDTLTEDALLPGFSVAVSTIFDV
ncbi:MAG: Uma2 family endonuclease [Aggregatilineales bacterium]